MLWVLIAFFSGGRSSKLPPDFPFIGTETSDFRKEREKEWTSGRSEEGGRTVSWEPWAESGLLNFTLERIHNCFQFEMGVTQITVPLSAKTQSTPRGAEGCSGGTDAGVKGLVSFTRVNNTYKQLTHHRKTMLLLLHFN